MKKIIFSLIVLLTSLSACTDKDEVEISYRVDSNISAAHIFDDYEPFQEDDFNMNKDGWKLNLQVLVYNEYGQLVDKEEKLCSSLNEALAYHEFLSPGNYTIVSIADFREGLGGSDFRFWNITNEQNLQDLSISENQTIYPVAFETLGIDVQNIKIENENQSLSADIKPITSLVEIFMSDKDYSNWGIGGYSRFSVLTEGYFVKALKFKNNVRFFDNGELEYKYSEQISDYNIAISKVHQKWSEKEAPTGYNYRALLPEINKGFSFHIQKRDLPEEYYKDFVTFCGEFEVDGKSNVLPEIKSNKQYVVNMIFDAMQLVAMEYPVEYRHENYTEQFVKDYNKKLMEEMVNTKYENILGKDESYANTFLDVKANDYDVSGSLYTAFYPRSKANHYEQFITAAYLNEDFTNCCVVQLLLPSLSEDSFAYLKQLLSTKFQPEEEGKFGPTNFTYLEPGKSEDGSKYRVALQKTYNDELKKYIYLLSYNLRKGFF